MRKAGSTTPAADPAEKPSPPRFVLLAAGALVLSGLAAVGAALSLFGLKDWLFDSITKANKDAKPKDKKSVPELHDQVDLTVKSQLIATAVVLVALIVVALAVYKGRYWARWGVLGLWVLATFTGTLAGLVSVASIASDQPLGFKLPAFVSGVLFVAAVVLTNLRPSTEYFNHNRPVRPNRAGGGAPRRGLFAPREAAPAGRGGAARGSAGAVSAQEKPSGAPDRSRSKQRANADAVAKGAELARTRAKASKSRRTGS